MKAKLDRCIRIILASIVSLAVVAIICVIVALIASGHLTVKYVFAPNYAVGAILALMGLTRRTNLSFNKLDLLIGNSPSIQAQRDQDARENIRVNVNVNACFYIGLLNLALTAASEYLYSTL